VSRPEFGLLEIRDGLVADLVWGGLIRGFDVALVEIPPLGEVMEVDQYRVAGEGRIGLIRGVSVGARGRAERTELPQ